ncbi:arylsulfatase [Paraglaciecola aquimarina]|uniref:Arylsulfatase n=1 Tax=Paraglaciecola aquimarina TaxID=1235557 RepID=A0ABU3SYT0_9ALTE|nr:arylsulfatase [Paraglaciecola aquimarina]MDU0355127.1 arylsulfatase [Paraglaciecola aquimarina]
MIKISLPTLLALTIVNLLTACALPDQAQTSDLVSKKPNIVIVMTDDQGFGDLGINHNPIIQTPTIDALAEQSVRLSNFHVDPTCSPTRAALLTGKNSLKAGVWHTVMVRYLLSPKHETLAEKLQQDGYDTAIFGKWHLGDNYPYRPQEQGFNHVLIHGGGGVGQTPDYWGNTQFNDTYYRNGEPEKFDGYATTIWFDEAIKYITQPKDKPYFAYIALNAPHGPYRAPEAFIKPYLAKGLNRGMASFYGMITHIDGQVKKLRQAIRTTGEEDNTIFIFMTDNGSSYHPTDNNNNITKLHQQLKQDHPNWLPNGGLRGYKASTFEGGHRVPFYISYPNGNLKKGDYSTLTAHYDVMPTLLDFAGVSEFPDDIDGKSLRTLITEGSDSSLADRSIVITNQRVSIPSPERPVVVAKNEWRLLSQNGKEQLYNLSTDPSQMQNVISQHRDIAAELRKQRQAWWDDASKDGFLDSYIAIGNPAENPVRLNAMDWMEIKNEQGVPWFIGHQGTADERDYPHWLTREEDFQALPWYVDVEVSGEYQVRPYYHDIPAGTPVQKKYCVVDANGKRYIERVWLRSSHCKIDLPLSAGKQKLTAWFTDDETGQSKEKAAFYVYVEKR